MAGYAFLVKDVNISKVDSSGPMRISTDQSALLYASNIFHRAHGGGCGELVSPTGVLTVSESIVAKKNRYFSRDVLTLSGGDLYVEDPFGFVSRAQSCSMPKECEVSGLKTAQMRTGSVYQVWADNTLVTKPALLGGGTQLTKFNFSQEQPPGVGCDVAAIECRYHLPVLHILK